MRYLCRCPYCEKPVAMIAPSVETFRNFLALHLTKCTATPDFMTSAAAIEIADALIETEIDDRADA